MIWIISVIPSNWTDFQEVLYVSAFSVLTTLSSDTIQAGIPLSELNLHMLDTDTKLILAEKEQALLGMDYLGSEIIFEYHFGKKIVIHQKVNLQNRPAVRDLHIYLQFGYFLVNN